MKHGLTTVALLGLLASVGANGGLLPDMNGNPGDFGQRRAGAEVGASYRFGVTNAGLYRISTAVLQTAGITNPIGSEMRLYCQTQEVALFASTAGAMSAADYLLFYGVKIDSEFTRTNVYWLGTGGSGLRMDVRSAVTNSGATAVTSHWQTVVLDSDRYFIPNVRQTDAGLDHWYVTNLYDSKAENIAVLTDKRTTSGTAVLQLDIVGRTDNTGVNPDHQTEVKVNGTTISNFYFDGVERITGTCTFAASLLNNGSSTVALQQKKPGGVTYDYALLESLSLSYTRLLTATGQVLSFIGRSETNNYAVDGFSASSGLWLLDISAPFQPIRLTNYSVEAFGGGYRVNFGDVTAASNRYYLASTSTIVQVAGLEKTIFRNLADTNRQADFILICPYAFRKNAYRLLAHHYLEGLSIAVAPLPDIYNEFSYGIKDAAAIKQFLGYAFHHWRSPVPRYVLLAGDGNYDPMNNLGTSAGTDIIPVHMGPSYEWTAEETWFVTVNGSDNLADMALGRIAVTSDSALSNVVNKIIPYDALSYTNLWRKKAVLVADNVDPLESDPDFPGASDSNVYVHLTNTFTAVTKAYCGVGSWTPSQVHNTIMNNISSGMFAINYFGHGANDVWAKENFLTNSDVDVMSNAIFPLFTMMTCRNGYFQEPLAECLSEKLLEKGGGGSIASVAAADLSVEQFAEQFAYGFYEKLVNTQQCRRVGDAMNAGMFKLWNYSPSANELLFYNLLGDPAVTANPTH